MAEVHKENSLTGGRVAKASRIPRPITRRPALSRIQARSERTEPPTRSEPPPRAVTTLRPLPRVKAVPDFSKLHQKWEGKLRKAKEDNRKKAEVAKEFRLTPVVKFQVKKNNDVVLSPVQEQVQSSQDSPSRCVKEETHPSTLSKKDSVITMATQEEEEFCPDPASLSSILSGAPAISAARRATEASAAIARGHDFENLLRLSFYHKNQVIKAPASGKVNRASERDIYDQLLQASLAKSRTKTIRTVTKETRELNDVKINLDAAFSHVADPLPTENSGPSHQQPIITIHKSSQFSPLPAKPKTATPSEPRPPPVPVTSTIGTPSVHKIEPRPPPVQVPTPLKPPYMAVQSTVGRLVRIHDRDGWFYGKDQELCEINRGNLPRALGGRRECVNPVAWQLHQIRHSPHFFHSISTHHL